MANNFVRVTRLFVAEEVAAGENALSPAVDLRNIAQHGYFSIQLGLTGGGTAKVEYLCSNDGSFFAKPSSAADIVAGFTEASGPGDDGKDFYSFYPEVCGWIKFRVTEIGLLAPITVTLDIAIQ